MPQCSDVGQGLLRTQGPWQEESALRHTSMLAPASSNTLGHSVIYPPTYTQTVRIKVQLIL